MAYKFNPFTGNFDTVDSPDGVFESIVVDGGITLDDGSAAAPSISFTGDTNTGIFSPGADQLAISTNGTEKLIVKSDGKVGIGTSDPNYQFHVTSSFAVGASGFNQQLSFTNDTIQSLLLGTGYTPLKLNPLGGYVGIGTTSPSSILDINGDLQQRNGSSVTIGKIENAAGFYSLTGDPANVSGAQISHATAVRVVTNGSERARIDSSGRLLVGTSTARANLFNTTVSAQFQVEGTGTGDRVISLISSNSTGSSGPYFVFGKQNSGAVGGNTVVASADNLGNISFQGNDGTEFVEAARIETFVDGTPGANDMPGRLVFSVTADGAASPTEALRISNNRSITVSDGGHVVLGTTTGTKIGTATTQKIGFYNATPVVQPAAVADATDAASVIARLNDLLARLRTLGIIAT